MKKAIRRFSWLGMVFILLNLNLFGVSARPIPGRATAPPPAARATGALPPIGQTRTVNFTVKDDAFYGMTQRERVDQLRDWLLFTLMSGAGMSAKTLSEASIDLPASRQSYLRPVANFEYGEIRSVPIAPGVRLALLPAGDSPERLDRLAHIADEHRKNTGEIPTTLLIFDYKIDLNGPRAWLTRRANLNGAELFTTLYGYHERRVSRLQDLADFMTQVDDLTFAQADGAGLRLGGRKFHSRRAHNIRVEDIAAIWQSEEKIRAKWAAFQAESDRRAKEIGAQWQQRRDEYQKKWSARAAELEQQGALAGRARLEQEIAADRAKIEQAEAREQEQFSDEMRSRQRALRLVDTSGISLDPKWDYAGLRRFLTDSEPRLSRWALEAETVLKPADLEAAKQGLARKDEVPYLTWIDRLKKSDRPGDRRLAEMLWGEAGPYRYQAARYDGELQGTEVGMTLFYTDLLAKIWSGNIFGSAPVREITDFKTAGVTPLSRIYEAEINKLSSTRLWFGPDRKGFQFVGHRGQLLFARKATRIYAASSSLLAPGREAQPNALSAATLDWWDSHYEEVARYEPQYERLNEIMKWGLVVAWLNATEQSAQLGFLKAVPVERGNWFPEWVNQHPELRFQQWRRIGFYEQGYKGVQTEAMPILYSGGFPLFGQIYQISGGVSLPSPNLFKRSAGLPPRPAVSQMSLRSGLDLARVTPNLLPMLDGTTYKVTSQPTLTAVVATPKPGATFRSTTGQFAAGVSYTRTISLNAQGLVIESRIGGIEQSTFKVAPSANGFEVGLAGREADAGFNLTRRLSSAPAAEKGFDAGWPIRKEDEPIHEMLRRLMPDRSELIALDPDVKTGVWVEKGQYYLLEMAGGKKWLKVFLEKEPSPTVRDGKARAGDTRIWASNLTLDWVEPVAAKAELRQQPYIGVALIDGSTPGKLHLSAGLLPPIVIPIEIRQPQGTLRGQFDPATGRIYFRVGDLPPPLQQDPTLAGQRLSAADLQKVAKLEPDADGVIRYTPEPPPSRREELLNQLDRLMAVGRHNDGLQFASEAARKDPHLRDELSARYWGHRLNSSGRRVTAAGGIGGGRDFVVTDDNPDFDKQNWSPSFAPRTIQGLISSGRVDVRELIIGERGRSASGWIPPGAFIPPPPPGDAAIGGETPQPQQPQFRLRVRYNSDVPAAADGPDCEDQDRDGVCDPCADKDRNGVCDNCADENRNGVCDSKETRVYVVRTRVNVRMQ